MAELIEATKLAGALDLPVAHSGGEGSMCDMRGTDTELGSGADTEQQRERGKRGGGAGRRGGERGAWGSSGPLICSPSLRWPQCKRQAPATLQLAHARWQSVALANISGAMAAGALTNSPRWRLARRRGRGEIMAAERAWQFQSSIARRARVLTPATCA